LLFLVVSIRNAEWLTALSAGLGLVLAIVALLLLRRELSGLAIDAESEERHRKLVELFPEAVFIHRAGSIVYVNPLGLTLFGGRASDVLGRSPFELIPPEARAKLRERVRELLLSNKPAPLLEGRIVRRDGKLIDVESVAVPFLDQGEPAILVVMRDVTERNRALAELRQTQERLREQAALLDQVHDAILVVDPEDRILSWNEGAQRIYGWARADAVGKKASELLDREPSPAAACRATSCASAQQAAAARTTFETIHTELRQRGEWTGELAQQTKDGRALVVASHWTLLAEEAGRPQSCVIINIDITQKKQQETQTLRAQRLESIGTLAGGIAHDLNNALTPILMALKLLQRPRPETERQALLAAAQAGAERGAGMIRQLLTFARGGEGQRVRTDLPALLDEVRTLLAHSLPDSIAIEVLVEPDLRPVIGDATQLSQVLMNLGVNARDAMPTGGRLLLEARNVTLDEGFVRTQPQARPGPYVCLSVSDTGTGIPPEVLDRIFDPFFTTKEHGKGTGLGLAMVQGIVRGHDGFVNVHSEVGRGTRIVVYLPAG
jgi:PAS domain S-box-containing protein